MAVVIAKQTFRTPHARDMVVQGKPYDTKDPVVKAHPDMFDEPEGYAESVKQPTSTDDLGERSMSKRKRRKSKKVEQATAAPGEVRDVTYACDECDFTTTSERGLKVHSSHQH